MQTLFLDRDGVINVRTPGDYVKHPDAFIPTPGFETAMPMLAAAFDRIVVVTNQAGIGKGLMNEADLELVHRKMLGITLAAGGRIDGIYFCPHRSDAGCPCRKPATGMAWSALLEFPDIDFEQAWMVGDSLADMQFGQALGMQIALIEGKTEEAESLAKLRIPHQFATLLDFARFIC
jgi:D-glycero-D-manno-heptose 1,7-bisphosphate phosphatase